MFAELFVTCDIAVALRKAGFDEPCMGVWETHEFKGQQFEQLYICYNNLPPNLELFTKPIRKLMKVRPGLFQDKRTNEALPPWLYAAPIYQQVAAWFFNHNMRIHITFIAKDVYYKGENGAWLAAIIDTVTGKSMWPDFVPYKDKQYTTPPAYDNEIEALQAAIRAGCKILENQLK